MVYFNQSMLLKIVVGGTNGLLYIFIAAFVSAYREVVLSADQDKVLIITDLSVGFIDRTALGRNETRTHMTMVEDSVKLGNKFICKNPDSIYADICRTKSAVGGKFKLLIEKGHSILMQDNHLVLGPGPFDLNSDTYPVNIKEAVQFPEGDYHLDIREIIGGEVNAINPPTREFKE